MEAGLLTAEHIDSTVTLDIKLGQNGPTDGSAGVDARVTAQLRQIYHTSSYTVIHVCPTGGHDESGLVELVITPSSNTVIIE